MEAVVDGTKRGEALDNANVADFQQYLVWKPGEGCSLMRKLCGVRAVQSGASVEVERYSLHTTNLPAVYAGNWRPNSINPKCSLTRQLILSRLLCSRG